MSNSINKGTLYIVGTPIGNMGDISPRAAQTLREVDFVAAEDTRVTGKLLSRLGIPAKQISCREHNESGKSAEIIARLSAGESCALVTDAGMPCISDPGGIVVQSCCAAGIPIRAVPGPCAVSTALAVAGIGAERYCFEGFLPQNKKQRRERLESVKALRHTLVYYEAPHKLAATLADLREVLGDRNAALCRELTKLYEEVVRGTLSALLLGHAQSPKGEYVVVVEGAPPPQKRERVNKYAEFSKLNTTKGE